MSDTETYAEVNHAQLVQEKAKQQVSSLKEKHKPLVTNIYTADPSAHVFEGKIYVYPSHDIESDSEINDNGDQYNMRDYHVLSVNANTGEGTDHGVALSLDEVPWANKQLWAPDAAHCQGTYYLFFPARDQHNIFRIGVATSRSPAGPFTAEPDYLPGTFSIDPAVFEDDDGSYYLYFGGLWGGQLENWETEQFVENPQTKAADALALPSKVAKLNSSLLALDEPPRDIVVLDESGNPIKSGDNERRFFEASWVHKHNGLYYFSYSTGDTHKIVYATGNSPYGPFTYRGILLNPVLGWTNHHSIAEFEDKWYLFYHDSTLSGGCSHLRCVKMAEIHHNPDGTITNVNAYE